MRLLLVVYFQSVQMATWNIKLGSKIAAEYTCEQSQFLITEISHRA